MAVAAVAVMQHAVCAGAAAAGSSARSQGQLMLVQRQQQEEGGAHQLLLLLQFRYSSCLVAMSEYLSLCCLQHQHSCTHACLGRFVCGWTACFALHVVLLDCC